jgi:hypothetical protein
LVEQAEDLGEIDTSSLRITLYVARPSIWSTDPAPRRPWV